MQRFRQAAVQGIVNIWRQQQPINALQNTPRSSLSCPVAAKDGMAYATMLIYVAMFDRRDESNLRWLHGKLLWEYYVKKPHAISIGRPLWARHRSFPARNVIATGENVKGGVRLCVQDAHLRHDPSGPCLSGTWALLWPLLHYFSSEFH